MLEGAVGYASSSSSTPAPFSVPKFVSATSTVYDGQNRPILVAGWEHSNAPDAETVETIETWADSFEGDYTMADVVSEILSLDPITLSHTLYDDRGRPYEQRTYNVDDVSGGTYEFTRTWRDDLDRVVAELTPTGFTSNKYDALGRMISTCWWSKQPENNPVGFDCEEMAGGLLAGAVELTATQTDYDAFGNVLVSVHYDRRDTQNTAEPRITGKFARAPSGRLSLAGTPSSNAIITYTCNWYDAAKRLAATAYFGTNSTAAQDSPDSFFVNGPAPQHYAEANGSPIAAPIWECTGSGENLECNYELAGAVTPALVNRYGYDAAGRRIWSQDPRGIVTRTWHDLLGRTLLVAENWKDFPGNSGPDQSTPGGSGASNLTPVHTGPIRYTAYHHTRGGLLDMIVVIEPDVPDANITPHGTNGSIAVLWTEEGAIRDFMATDVTVAGAQVQATQLLYSENNVVAEFTAPIPSGPVSPPGSISTYPNLVSQIRYPHLTTGKPNPDDAVLIKYTPTGQIARRTDQRGVDLYYEYGTVSPYSGGEHLDAVRANFGPGATNVDAFVDRVEFQHSYGLLASAKSLKGTSVRNEGRFYYDGFRKLLREEQSPFATWSPRTTQYQWGPSANGNGTRLEQIIYPSGLRVAYSYGSEATASAAHNVQRMTAVGLADANGAVTRPLAAYDYTGAGRKRAQTWGDPNQQPIFSDYSPDHGRGPGLDRFGRVSRLTIDHPGGLFGDNVLHEYKYRYDANGNQLSARIQQANLPNGDSHYNSNSYVYQYDQLNRLIFAASGQMGLAEEFLPGPTRATSWSLDVLGNWSGASGVQTWSDVVAPIGEPDFGSISENHTVNQRNQLTSATIAFGGIPEPDGSSPPVPTEFEYDAAGNLTRYAGQPDTQNLGLETGFNFTYDAWNRLASATRLDDGKKVAEYQYDALGRRIRKKIGCTPGLNTLLSGERYYYAGSRIIERFGTIGLTGSPWPCGGGGSGEFKLISDLPGTTAQSKEFRSADPNTSIHLDDHPELDPAFESQMRESNAPDPLADNPKLAAQAVAPPATMQEYVYGLEYVDEHVAVQAAGQTQLVIQDPGYNVVALVDFLGYGLTYQSLQTPYGHFHYIENAAGQKIDTGVHPASTTTGVWYPFWHKGRWFDQEIYAYHYINRTYPIVLGRFAQTDPIGSALVLSTASSINAEVPHVFAQFSRAALFSRGHGYEYLASSPIAHGDPAGLQAMNYFDEVDSIVLGIATDRSVMAAHVMRNLEAFKQTSFNIALAAGKTYLAVVFPAYGLYLAAEGVIQDVSSLSENGWDIWTGVSLAANVLGVPGSAIQSVRQARRLAIAAGDLKFARLKGIRAARPKTITNPGVSRPWMDGPADTKVYVGYVNNEAKYIGITRQQIVSRQSQHGSRMRIEELTPQSFSRNQARAVEQAIMENKPGLINVNNSISPLTNESWYDEAVDWGESWLHVYAPDWVTQ